MIKRERIAVCASMRFFFLARIQFLCLSSLRAACLRDLRFGSVCVANVIVLHRAVVLYFGLVDSGAWFTGHVTIAHLVAHVVEC